MRNATLRDIAKVIRSKDSASSAVESLNRHMITSFLASAMTPPRRLAGRHA